MSYSIVFWIPHSNEVVCFKVYQVTQVKTGELGDPSMTRVTVRKSL